MSSILITGILFVFASTLAVMSGKRMEEHLPLTVGSVVGVLYAFALFGGLQTGFYAVLLLCALCAAMLLFRLIARRKQRLWKLIVSPGCMVYFLIALWLLISFRGYMFTQWDDFSHWGLAVKNMFLFSALPSGVEEATIKYVDYPPATTLFSWFWARLSGAFNEGDCQRALNMMTMCYLLPALKKQEWRRPGRLFAVSTLLFVIPLAANPEIYRSLQVDGLLGCQALYILYTWFDERHDRPAMMNIGITLFLMPLVKETGMLIAALVLVIMLADLLTGREKHGKELVQTILLLLLPLAIGSLSWNIYLRAENVAQVWDKSVFSLDALLSLLTGTGPTYHKRVIVEYVKYLYQADWWRTGHVIKLSHLMWILLMAGLQCWNVNQMTDPVAAKRYQKGFLLLRFEMVLYVFGLLMMYLFLFRPDEATKLVSMDRYLSSFLLPMIGWTVLTASTVREKKTVQGDSHAAYAVLLGMLLVVNPVFIAQDTVLAYEVNTAAYEMRMNELISEKVISQVNSDTDKIYFVACNDEGYQHYMGAYQFTPVPVQRGTWSSWPVCKKEEVWYEKWAVEYSPQQWSQVLLDGGFTHVYLDTVDDRFAQDYASLFEAGSAAQSGVLYRVEADGDCVKLISLQ